MFNYMSKSKCKLNYKLRFNHKSKSFYKTTFNI